MKWLVILMAFCMVTVGGWTTTQAQSDSLITYVNYFTTRDGNDALQLDLFFSIVDNQQNVIENLDVAQLGVTLSDGGRYLANAVQPNLPFDIVLLLDTSGSMTASNAAMRQAAEQTIASAPDNARFAVYTFNEVVTAISDFGDSNQHAISQIQSIRSTPDAGTCMYNATAQAISLLASQQPGRRAVVLFTDGVDRRADGSPCSSIGATQVIQRATAAETRTPIYALGLEGDDLDRDGLTRLSRQTGGFAAFGGDIEQLFRDLMQKLSNQWFAQLQLRPVNAGSQRATIQPVLEGGLSPQSTEIVFNSRAYLPQPNIGYGDIRYDEAADVVRLPIAVAGAQSIRRLQVGVVNEQTNNLVYESNYDQLPTTIDIPGSELERGQSYLLRITAIDQQGRQLFGDTEPIEFTYTGPDVAPLPELQILPPERREDTQQLIFPLLVSGDASQIARIEYSITDEQTGQVVGARQSEVGVPVQLAITTANLATGNEYTLFIVPFAPDNTPLTDIQTALSFRNGLFTMPQVTIEAIDHQPGTWEIALDLHIINAAAVSDLRVSFVDEDTGIRVYEVLTDGVQQRITLSLETLGKDPRSLRVQVMPLNAARQPAAPEPAQQEFQFTPPARTFTEQLGPIFWVIVVVLALVILSALYTFVQNWRQNRGTQRNRKPDASSPKPAPMNETRFIMDPPVPVTHNKKTPEQQARLNQAYQARFGVQPQPAAYDNSVTHVLAPASTCLIIKSKTVNGHTEPLGYKVVGQNFPVGRNAQDEKLKLVINAEGVSRSHMTFVYDAKRKSYVVRDHHSTSGTYIMVQDSDRRVALYDPHGDPDSLLQSGILPKDRLIYVWLGGKVCIEAMVTDTGTP